MKNHIKKQLKQYSVLASIITAGGSPLAAQVIYTDIPDTSGLETITGTTINHEYGLDLNNDGTVDFDLNATSLPSSVNGKFRYMVTMEGLNSNEILEFGSAIGDAAKYECNDSIPGNVSNYGGFILAYRYQHCNNCQNYSDGNWLFDTVPGLVGLRFELNNQTHFGWARISAQENGGGFTLYDYAYEASVETPIVGCNMSSANVIESLENASRHLNTYTENGYLHFLLNIDMLPSKLTLVNSIGQVCFVADVMQPDFKVPVQKFSKGLYIAELESPQGKLSGKIIFD